MDVESLIGQLASGADAVGALMAGYTDEQARARPADGAWSPLEVIAHLLDEELEDFRPRLDVVLHRPTDKWSPIDPEGWVTAREYNGWSPEETLASFGDERALSIAWIRGLAGPDWDATYNAPWGPIRAGDLLAAWAAHDTLHLRQLVELRRVRDEALAKPYSVRYAGDW